MAMHAGEIAKFAHIDLENFGTRPAERERTFGQASGRIDSYKSAATAAVATAEKFISFSRCCVEAKRYTNGSLSIVSMKKCGAEFIGTFALVFAGTGAIVINETSGGAITHVGISLTFGLIVLAMIYTVGDISGAHLNPAVSLGFFAAPTLPVA